MPVPELMDVPGEVAAEARALSVGRLGSISAAGGRSEVDEGVAEGVLE